MATKKKDERRGVPILVYLSTTLLEKIDLYGNRLAESMGLEEIDRSKTIRAMLAAAPMPRKAASK